MKIPTKKIAVGRAVVNLVDLHKEVGYNHPFRNTSIGFLDTAFDFNNRILNSIRMSSPRADGEALFFSDDAIIDYLFSDLEHFKNLAPEEEDFLEAIKKFEDAYCDAASEVRDDFCAGIVANVREGEARGEAR